MQAHRHVLFNAEGVEPFIQTQLKRRHRSNRRITVNEIERMLHREFVDWFHRRIMNDENETHTNDLKLLARGPLYEAMRYTAFDVNGFASTADNRPIQGSVPYYGRLTDIVELNYGGRFVTLFRCDWANTLTT
ncbi:hypothetical protein LINPERHAP1_LOCUS4591, partial [Linum perenne]